MSDYLIHAVLPDVLTAVRAAAPDPLIIRRTAPDEPLRCCLRNAVEGEDLILFNYELPLPPSPYREAGPVFIHANPCSGPESVTSYPVAWIGRPQVLRAYNHRGWIHDALTHDGTNPDPLILQFLADPEVEQVHSRNVAYGCYMFTITRR
jgi:hypothetical protein